MHTQSPPALGSLGVPPTLILSTLPAATLCLVGVVVQKRMELLCIGLAAQQRAQVLHAHLGQRREALDLVHHVAEVAGCDPRELE